jgi:hypothetical protein
MRTTGFLTALLAVCAAAVFLGSPPAVQAAEVAAHHFGAVVTETAQTARECPAPGSAAAADCQFTPAPRQAAVSLAASRAGGSFRQSPAPLDDSGALLEELVNTRPAR